MADPNPPSDYYSMRPPSDYDAQDTTHHVAVPLVPPPVSKQQQLPAKLPELIRPLTPPQFSMQPKVPVSVTPPPRPPPTAPHDTLDYVPSAPPEPSAPPSPPPPAPPTETHVAIANGASPKDNRNEEKPTESKAAVDAEMSRDDLPAYIGFLFLGVLLGAILSFFAFIFHCCVPGLKMRPVRRNFFNAGVCLGILCNVGLIAFLALEIKRIVKHTLASISNGGQNV